ncbi:MAG: hypothetical protein HRU17_06860, partial [Polyangiaceae bacterium]|nr:hypothetical protein [Polyangiaceae bacterium]
AAPAEECEPPNTGVCDASCQDIVAAVCGDGIVNGVEDCDDDNDVNLDGCDTNCRYELLTRFDTVALVRGDAPAWCDQTENRLPNGVRNVALGDVNDGIQDNIDDGITNVLFQFLPTTQQTWDPTGTAGSVNVGILDAAPDPIWNPVPNASLDTSFGISSGDVDGSNIPTSLVPGTFAGKDLAMTGTGTASIPLMIGGSLAVFDFLELRVQAGVGADTAPAPPFAMTYAAAFTALETLDGTGTDGLCGNITVHSLANAPVPTLLAEGGDRACSQDYIPCAGDVVTPSCNSLLDVFVGGCNYFITLIDPTLPDVPRPGGSILALVRDEDLQGATGSKVPLADTDGNLDSYSTYMRFTAERVHPVGTY